MNAEVVVHKLRRAQRYCLNEYSQMAGQAADLIESLQAQLAESQRREQAAQDMIGKWPAGGRRGIGMTERRWYCPKCGNVLVHLMGEMYRCRGCAYWSVTVTGQGLLVVERTRQWSAPSATGAKVGGAGY